MSSADQRLPFMLSYYQSQRPDGTHVQRYVNEKSSKLLDLLGETRTKDTEWHVHSHGAYLAVETELSDLFERLMLVLPRPEQHSPKLFIPWAEGRLKHFARYIEQTNSGKVVRFITQKQVVIAIVMRRVGYELQDPNLDLPPTEKIPALLKVFCREINMYTKWMSDYELSFIQALKLNNIPQANRFPVYKFSLDILPTVLGLRGKSIPLNPVTLLRGVIGELAEQIDLRGTGAPNVDAEGIHVFFEYLRQKRVQREVDACIQELDHLAARIDLLQPDFEHVSRWVQELDQGEIAPLIPLRLVIAMISVSAAVLLYWFH